MNSFGAEEGDSVATVEASTINRPIEPATQVIPTPRILLVEDYPLVHDLIRTELRDEHFEIESAYDAATGIVAAKNSSFDLILLDVELPDFSGFEVCRLLKADPACSRAAVIFLTAFAGVDHIKSGFKLEAADYITKPFEGRDLRERIRAAIRIKRMLDLVRDGDSTDGPQSVEQSRLTLQRLPLQKLVVARKLNPWQRIAPTSKPQEVRSLLNVRV